MFAKKLFARPRSRRLGSFQLLEERRMFATDLHTAAEALVSAAPANGAESNGTSGLPTNLSTVAAQLTHDGDYYAAFVTWAYQQFMGRGPDAGGLAGWVTRLEQGLTDEQLESSFISAPEYIAVHGGSAVQWVIGMYHDLLNRAPDSGGIAGWTQEIDSGVSEYSIAFGFATSPEREGIVVSKDYQTYLGRSPSQGDINGWVDLFENHGQRNEDVIAGFIDSSEYFNGPNRGAGNATTWLDSVFNELYQRSPTDAELNSWLNQLGQGGTTLTAPSVSATAMSATQASLSWNAISGAVGYTVDELVNGAWQEIGQVDGGTTSLTVNGLSPNTTYQFIVGAYNSAGTAWSSTSSVTTNVALSAPSVAATALSSTQASLSWYSVSGAAGYTVDELVNGAWQQIGQFDGGTTSITVNNLSPNTTYEFIVGAYNSAGTAWSSPSAVTTNASLTAPSVAAAAMSATQASLSWNSVTGAAGYTVDELVNGAWQQIGQVESGTTSVTVNNLSPNTTYEFIVGAYNSAGTAWSSPSAVTTNAALAAPSVAATALSSTQAGLSWNSVSDAAGYTVDELVNGVWQQIGQVDGGTTSVTVNNLSPNTTYEFIVGAYNSTGTAWSTPSSVTTNAALTAPSVAATALSSTQASLSWNFVSGATGYSIDELVNGVWQQIGQVDGGTTSVTVNNLSPNTTYEFIVGAYNSTGTAWSSPSSVTTNSPPVTIIQPAASAAYTPVSGTLFGATGPVYSDVHQGSEGDCWLMASLAEVAARDPQDIRSMFTYQGTAMDNGAMVDLYSVRFFNRNGTAEYVTVDTELPGNGQVYDHVQNGILWVALAEKAYAEANGAGYVRSETVGSNSYSALNEGYPSWALQAITGRAAADYNINSANVAAAFNAGELVVLGTSPSANDNLIVGDSSGTHAYAMINYAPSSNLPFELYNPWGLAGEVPFNGHMVFGGAFYANAALISQDFAGESFGSGTQPTDTSPQAVALATPPYAGADAIENLARDIAAASTVPANAARDSVFAEDSWMDAIYN